MTDFLTSSAFFGVTVSLLTYFLGTFLKKRFRLGIFNPLLLSILFTIGILLVFRIDYKSYYEGARYISYLLTPATICLAIPLYEQFEALRKNAVAILVGILSGVITSLLTILVLALLLGFTHAEYVTFLPKSITTAIGMGISEELGGSVSVTVIVIILTGVLGNVIAEAVLRLLRITEPAARGAAIGTSAHAVGTARAMELGPVEGAISSLSIVIAGLLTVVGASLFSSFL